MKKNKSEKLFSAYVRIATILARSFILAVKENEK